MCAMVGHRLKFRSNLLHLGGDPHARILVKVHVACLHGGSRSPSYALRRLAVLTADADRPHVVADHGPGDP